MTTASYASKLISDLILECDRDNILFGYIIGLCEYDSNDKSFNKKNDQLISDSLELSRYLIEFQNFEAFRIKIENSIILPNKFGAFEDFKEYVEATFLKFGIRSSELMFDVFLSRNSTGNSIVIDVPDHIERIFDAHSNYQ